jgi:hypothetical protein
MVSLRRTGARRLREREWAGVRLVGVNCTLDGCSGVIEEALSRKLSQNQAVDLPVPPSIDNAARLANMARTAVQRELMRVYT